MFANCWSRGDLLILAMVCSKIDFTSHQMELSQEGWAGRAGQLRR